MVRHKRLFADEGVLCVVCGIRPVVAGKQCCFRFQCRQSLRVLNCCGAKVKRQKAEAESVVAQRQSVESAVHGESEMDKGGDGEAGLFVCEGGNGSNKEEENESGCDDDEDMSPGDEDEDSHLGDEEEESSFGAGEEKCDGEEGGSFEEGEESNEDEEESSEDEEEFNEDEEEFNEEESDGYEEESDEHEEEYDECEEESDGEEGGSDEEEEGSDEEEEESGLEEEGEDDEYDEDDEGSYLDEEEESCLDEEEEEEEEEGEEEEFFFDEEEENSLDEEEGGFLNGDDEDWVVGDEDCDGDEEQTLSGEACDDSEYGNAEDSLLRSCRNCRRRELSVDEGDLPEHMRLGLEMRAHGRISFRRRYSSIRSSQCGRRVLLCSPCTEYLILCPERKRRIKAKVAEKKGIWASYLWSCLGSREIGDRFWRFFPQLMRDWWHGAIGFIPSGGCAVVQDITVPRLKLIGSIKRGLIADIIKVTDEEENLCPTVLCPWGCTTHPHHVGRVPFDCMVQLCNPYWDFDTISDEARHSEVQSARLDYMRSSPGEYQRHLLKSEWRVLPSVMFTDDGPAFATCEMHNGGTRKAYFHPPRMPLYAPIPAKRSDQLSHVVLKPRILKAKKRRMLNTTYETVEIRACYSGSDTVNVTDTGDFSFTSHLTERNESLAISGRLDIRSHMRHLQRNGQLTSGAVKGMEERAQRYFGHVDLQKWKEGSTFMTLGDAVSLQGQISGEGNMRVRVPVDPVRGQGARRNATKVAEHPRRWPIQPVWIHRATATGARFRDLPQFCKAVHDPRCAWVLLGMLSTSSLLFASADRDVHDLKEWNGWFLFFAARSCLQLPYGAGKRVKDHPYDKVPSLRKLVDLVLPTHPVPVGTVGRFDSRQLTSLLSSVPRASCLELDLLEEDDIASALGQHARHNLPANGDINKGWAIVCTRPADGESFGVANGLPESFTCNQQVSGQVVETVFFLRMVVLLPEGHGSVNTWDGTIIARHDPTEFGDWWYQRRKGKMTAVASLGEVGGLEEWRVAVYLTDDRKQVEELRNQYLHYIGGQAKMFCAEHDVPLITAASDKSLSRLRCYCSVGDTICGKKLSMCCVVGSCRTWICSDCYKTRTSSDGRVDYPSCPSDVSFGDDAVGVESSPGESERQSEPGGEPDADVLRDVPVHIDDILVVEPELAEDDLEVYNEDPPVPAVAIPTTIAGNRPLHIRANITGESIHEIPGHVLLNGCGTLLVRRSQRLNGNRTQQNFVQKLAATTEGVTIPVMFMEGALFPSIFWAASNDNASILGAIPSCLFAQPTTVSAWGVASMRDHTRSRITCADSLAGTDPRYYAFMFDVMANVALNNRYSRLVLNRGFVENQGPSGLAVADPESSCCVSDFIDSRQTVRNLSATERDLPFSLFVTITCNQMQQFGVRMYIQWLKRRLEWTTGYYHFEDLSPDVEDEIEEQLHQAASSLILRNWLEVRKIIIDYLVNSLEAKEGIGHVLKIFGRDEYQDGEGNLPHFHLLLALAQDISTDEGLRFVENLVRGSSAEIVREDEVDRFVEMGLLKNRDEWIRLQHDAKLFLSHNRCSQRCMRRLLDGTLVCRVPDNHLSSPDPLSHVHLVYDPGHTMPAIQLMAELGLCEEPPSDQPNRFRALVRVLEACKHYPPTSRGEGKFSSANGFVFAICRGNSNAQVCRTFATSRYLCKYIGKIDENNAVWLVMDKNDERAASMKKVFLHNTKIDSSARADEKFMDKRGDKKKKLRARSMAMLEMYQRELGFPSTVTNIDYVRVATCPMEERRGIERVAPVDSRINPMLRRSNLPGVTCLSDLHSDAIDSITCRNSLPLWRQFGLEQQLVIRDSMFCSVSIDKVTVFSVRPCELVGVFDTLVAYFKFFTRSTRRTQGPGLSLKISQSLERSSWIDGLGFEVKVRYRAIDSAVAHFDSPLGIQRGRRIVHALFEKIKQLKDEAAAAGRRVPADEDDADFFCRFVDLEPENDRNPMKPRTLPTVVFSDVKPTNPTKFLLHLLLSMGSFTTEYELLRQPDMYSAFVHAELLVPRGSPGFEESVRNLIRRYIVEQLAYAPISTRTLDYYLVEAGRVIREVLVEDRLTITDMPGVLFTSLQTECSANIEAALAAIKHTVVDATFGFLSWLADNSPGFPTKQELLDGTVCKGNPHPWTGQLVKNTAKGQSEASFLEHQRCAEAIRNMVTKYSMGVTEFIKALLIVGGPGCGKTFEMMYGVLQFLCKGCLVITTALLSARARTLGGIHFHRLFCLRKGRTPQQIAEAAVIAVMKNPILYAFFLRLDAIAIDEFGQLSAELFSAFDIFLRILRGVNTFFGGVVVIGSIDHVQIRTFTGLPVLLSPHILTSFNIQALEHSVRAARDANLRSINDLCRLPKHRLLENNGRLLEDFVSLVSDHCTFVDNWDSPLIPKDAVRIFGRKIPVRNAEKVFRDGEVKRCQAAGLPFVIRRSVDTQMASESHANWQVATRSVSEQLSHKVKEPRELLFFEYAVYEFTCNKNGFYSQTQLAVACEVPTAATVTEFGAVEVIVAPPGLRFVGFQVTSRQQLVDLGWKPILVRPEQQYTQTLRRGVRARRQQYPLKPNIASTLHGAMGSEVSAVATQLSMSDKTFALWEKGQLVVLVSRTEAANKIFFVGNKQETLMAIRHIVLMCSQYDEYIQHVLDVLSRRNAPGSSSVPPVVNMGNHYLRPMDVKLPQGGTGVSYLLVSTKDYATTYIGQTMEYVGDRVKRHNAGHGADQTADAQHRPWGLLACVVGFDRDTRLLVRFERDWKIRRRTAVVHNHGSITPVQVANLAVVVMQYDAYRDKGLRFILNGEVA